MVTTEPVGNVTVQTLVIATRAHLRTLHLHSSISSLRASQAANTSERCGGLAAAHRTDQKPPLAIRFHFWPLIDSSASLWSRCAQEA